MLGIQRKKMNIKSILILTCITSAGILYINRSLAIPLDIKKLQQWITVDNMKKALEKALDNDLDYQTLQEEIHNKIQFRTPKQKDLFYKKLAEAANEPGHINKIIQSAEIKLRQDLQSRKISQQEYAKKIKDLQAGILPAQQGPVAGSSSYIGSGASGSQGGTSGYKGGTLPGGTVGQPGGTYGQQGGATGTTGQNIPATATPSTIPAIPAIEPAGPEGKDIPKPPALPKPAEKKSTLSTEGKKLLADLTDCFLYGIPEAEQQTKQTKTPDIKFIPQYMLALNILNLIDERVHNKDHAELVRNAVLNWIANFIINAVEREHSALIRTGNKKEFTSAIAKINNDTKRAQTFFNQYPEAVAEFASIVEKDAQKAGTITSYCRDIYSGTIRNLEELKKAITTGKRTKADIDKPKELSPQEQKAQQVASMQIELLNRYIGKDKVEQNLRAWATGLQTLSTNFTLTPALKDTFRTFANYVTEGLNNIQLDKDQKTVIAKKLERDINTPDDVIYMSTGAIEIIKEYILSLPELSEREAGINKILAQGSQELTSLQAHLKNISATLQPRYEAKLKELQNTRIKLATLGLKHNLATQEEQAIERLLQEKNFDEFIILTWIQALQEEYNVLSELWKNYKEQKTRP